VTVVVVAVHQTLHVVKEALDAPMAAAAENKKKTDRLIRLFFIRKMI
jgi:hypothetical protein